MFSGIVKGLCEVVSLEVKPNLLTFAVRLSDELAEGLCTGASVAVDGVCLTASFIEGRTVYFDVISETLAKTTLKDLEAGKRVNVERSIRLGGEIGGHILSGHVWGLAPITLIEKKRNETVVTVTCSPQWMKYIFPKGFIAIDGASLTVVDVADNRFTVHLIPETLKMTTLGFKEVGDFVNIEIDSNTQAIVDTVERIHQMS